MKEKVDAGAEFVITQMFLDPEVFLDFQKEPRYWLLSKDPIRFAGVPQVRHQSAHCAWHHVPQQSRLGYWSVEDCSILRDTRTRASCVLCSSPWCFWTWPCLQGRV